MKTDLLNIFFKERNQNLFSSRPIIIAHRGASGYEPENTLRSFKRAIDIASTLQEVIAIELDVFLCGSSTLFKPQIVVIHDETIDRTTNGHGWVKKLGWDQLKKYDAGKGEHIPLLSEVLDIIDIKILKYIILNIELKDPATVQPVADLITHYINHKDWAYHNFIISSFDHDAIKKFNSYLPEIKTGAMFFETKADLIKNTHKAQAHYLIIDYPSITHNLIRQAHSEGLFVFVYTVNDTFIAQELASWGIDGIITDYPDIVSTFSINPLYH